MTQPPPSSSSRAGQPVVEIVHKIEFSAAHRLHSPALSEEDNQRTFGPCLTVHGHNYEVEVYVRGAVHPTTGMVMNLNDLMNLVREKIFSQVDHRTLNDVSFLAGVVPTAENIAIAFWNQLEADIAGFEGCRLHRIRLYESRNNFVDYLGPTATA